MMNFVKILTTGSLCVFGVTRACGVLLLDQGVTTGYISGAAQASTDFLSIAESVKPDSEVAVNAIRFYGERLPLIYGTETLNAALFRVSFFSANYDQLGYPLPGSVLKYFDIMSDAPSVVPNLFSPVGSIPIQFRTIKLPELFRLNATQRYFIAIVPVGAKDAEARNGPILLTRPGEGVVWLNTTGESGWRTYSHGDLAFQLYGYGSQFKPDAVPEPASALVLAPLLLFIKHKKNA